MFKVLLEQIAIIYFGSEEKIFTAFLFYVSPTLIAIALICLFFFFKHRWTMREPDHSHSQIIYKPQSEIEDLKADIAQLNQTLGNSSKYSKEQIESKKEERYSVGEKFELTIKRLLENKFADDISSGKMHVYHNVKIDDTYKDKDGKYNNRIMQLDLVIVDVSGIYIIDCKWWNGLIFRNESWDRWLVVPCEFNDNDHKKPIFRPVDDDYNLPIDNVYARKNLTDDIRKQTSSFSKWMISKGFRGINQYKRMVVFKDNSKMKFIHLDSPSQNTNNKGVKYFTWIGMQSEFFEKVNEYKKEIYFTIDQVKAICKLIDDEKCAKGAEHQNTPC